MEDTLLGAQRVREAAADKTSSAAASSILALLRASFISQQSPPSLTTKYIHNPLALLLLILLQATQERAQQLEAAADALLLRADAAFGLILQLASAAGLGPGALAAAGFAIPPGFVPPEGMGAPPVVPPPGVVPVSAEALPTDISGGAEGLPRPDTQEGMAPVEQPGEAGFVLQPTSLSEAVVQAGAHTAVPHEGPPDVVPEEAVPPEGKHAGVTIEEAPSTVPEHLPCKSVTLNLILQLMDLPF
jgi:hypothetical protein